MAHVSYTDLRQNLARYMDEVVDSRAPLVITRQGGKGNVVMIAEEEWEGWMETLHLLGSPRNAERLKESIRRLDAGEGEEHEPVTPDTAADRA